MIATPEPRLIGDDPAAALKEGIADRGELAFVAMERSRMPMVVTSVDLPDNPIVLANRAFLDLTGYEAHEVIGRNCRFLQGPDTDPKAIAAIREAIGAGREITIELLNYTKRGEPFWNQLLSSPVFDSSGRLIYFFASQMDVTRRRQAQALEMAEHRLLREVDHRAKNALALVQGIVRLSRHDDPDAYAHAVQGRVDALARAHALLSDHHWRDIAIHTLVDPEARSFGHTRIVTEGPDVALSPARVQPLMLVLHELLTNAARHGALSCPGGTITIRWTADADGSVTLGWRERGGPAPSGRRCAGFGSTMIDTIVRRQLGGRIAFDWDACGLAITLVFRRDSRAALADA